MIPYQGCELRELDHQQVQRFVEDGFLVIADLIPQDVVAAVVPEIEQALGEIPRQPELWGGHGGYLLKDSPDTAATARAVGARYRRVVEDLCGPGRIQPMGSGLGYMPIRFPDPEGGPWAPTGWHVDGNHFHHHVHSREQGLVAVELWTDIAPEGGGTAIRVGSNRVVSRLLAAAEPAGLTSGELNAAAAPLCEDLPVVEITGRAGSVLFMHPHTYHGSSRNCSRRTRIAGNKCIALQEPMVLERADAAAYSPVEFAVVAALVAAE